ncbi:hypothetical protein Hanom_Chr04g00325341 [Helianthus anomalus]
MLKPIKFFNPKKTKTKKNAARSSFSYFPASFRQKLQVSSRNSSPESATITLFSRYIQIARLWRFATKRAIANAICAINNYVYIMLILYLFMYKFISLRTKCKLVKIGGRGG